MLLQSVFRSLQKMLNTWDYRGKMRRFRKWESLFTSAREKNRELAVETRKIRFCLAKAYAQLRKVLQKQVRKSFEQMVRMYSSNKKSAELRDYECKLQQGSEQETVELFKDYETEVMVLDEIKKKLESLTIEESIYIAKTEIIKEGGNHRETQKQGKKITEENRKLKKQLNSLDLDIERFIGKMDVALGNPPAPEPEEKELLHDDSSKGKKRVFKIAL